MKKLSLVLALILVLTCGVLAACGGDEDTSSATSSTAAESSKPAEESKAPVEESKAPAEESKEAPAESSEAPAEESKDEAPAEITGENIASTATYTTSPLYRQGPDWNWSDTADIAYDDEGGKSLTDGLFATVADFFDAAWAGFHANCPAYTEAQHHAITFDLGEAKDITGVKVYVGTEELGSGIAAPAGIEVFVSADGNEWTSIGSTVPTNVTTEAGIATECVAIAGAGNGQFVQIRITGEAWSFVSEVEIFA